MAITRAQQAKQMLQDGGMLVRPSTTGKRPGYRGDAASKAAEARGDKTSRPGPGPGERDRRDPGESDTPGFNPNTGRFEKPDGTPEDSYTPPTDKEIREIFNLEDDRKIGETKKEYKKRTKKTFLDTFKKFGLPTQRLLYNVFPNNPNTELAFLSGLTQEQVDALNNKELSDLYGAIKDADFSGDLSFEDALGDKYGKLSFDAFKALSQRGIDTNFQDPQGEFGNMDFAEYAARIKGKPGLLFSGNVGNIETIKNPDGTYGYREKTGGGDDRSNDPCKGPNPPAYCFIGRKADDTMAAAEAINPIFYRIMADGGMTGDAPMMQGGITDLALRDEFFLGGVVKGIKKGLKGVTRAVKKVAKSPIGKAALLAAGGSYALGLGPFASGSTMFGGKLAGLRGAGFLKSQGVKDFFFKGGVPGFKNLTDKGIIAALTATPFIGELLGLNKQEEEEPIFAGPGLDFNAQQFYRLAADGGLMRQQYQEGSKEPVAKKTMPLIDMGGKEKDYRETGGFVDMGRMEKADDVPARLSKNEFVFTAEAVRNAGDGDVDKGSEVMYNMMKNLESGGDISEESQGLDGARKMFQTSQRLEEVL